MKILSVIPLLILFSCGKAPAPDGPSVFSETLAPDGSNISGFYAAELQPLNHNFHFKTLGAAHIKREGDTLGIMVNLTHSGSSVWHRQDIYQGARCPTLQDDKNKDGYIDIVEAKAAIGDVVVPLDADIDNQYAGRNEYPTGDAAGAYTYVRTGSFERFFADLRSEDENTADNIVKVSESDGFSFLNKVVLIQGLRDEVTLPPFVASVNGLSRHTTLPIACGVIKKSQAIPEALAQSVHQGSTRNEAPTVDPVPTPAPAPAPVPGPEIDEDDDGVDGWIRRTWRRWTRRTPSEDTPPPPPDGA